MIDMIDYATHIDLHEPFTPAQGAADLETVVSALRLDPPSAPFVQQHRVPRDQVERRRWVRAALTVRPPGHLAPELVQGTDRLLQAELFNAPLTNAAELPRLVSKDAISARLSIWEGDITTLQVDAITNAANAELLGCYQPFHGCIDNAIHCAAGPRLREDCHQIVTHQGAPESTGRAKVTRGYNLPSRYVLHTVGPVVREGDATAEHAGQLASCYTTCLSLAAELGLSSVALCAVSTGVFGYPMAKAAQVAVESVTAWLRHHPDGPSHVVFNTYGEAATKAYSKALTKWSAS